MNEHDYFASSPENISAHFAPPTNFPVHAPHIKFLSMIGQKWSILVHLDLRALSPPFASPLVVQAFGMKSKQLWTKSCFPHNTHQPHKNPLLTTRWQPFRTLMAALPSLPAQPSTPNPISSPRRFSRSTSDCPRTYLQVMRISSRSAPSGRPCSTAKNSTISKFKMQWPLCCSRSRRTP